MKKLERLQPYIILGQNHFASSIVTRFLGMLEHLERAIISLVFEKSGLIHGLLAPGLRVSSLLAVYIYILSKKYFFWKSGNSNYMLYNVGAKIAVSQCSFIVYITLSKKLFWLPVFARLWFLLYVDINRKLVLFATISEEVCRRFKWITARSF